MTKNIKRRNRKCIFHRLSSFTENEHMHVSKIIIKRRAHTRRCLYISIWIYKYVFIWTRFCVCMCVYIYIYIYILSLIHACAQVCLYMHKSLSTYEYVLFIHMFLCVRVYIFVHMVSKRVYVISKQCIGKSLWSKGFQTVVNITYSYMPFFLWAETSQNHFLIGSRI